MPTRRVLLVVLYGLGCALVALTTIAISIPNGVGGYINFGDSMIFALALLGGPGLAAIAGGMGSALADLAQGYPHWIIFTLVIKGLEGLVAGLLAGGGARKLNHAPTLIRAVFGLTVAALWMLLGYFLAGGLVVYGFAGALAELPGNMVQAVVSIPVGLLLAWMLRSGADRLISLNQNR